MTRQGMCGSAGPDRRPTTMSRLNCHLDWGHGGWHECEDWESIPAGVLAVAPVVKWSRVTS